MEAHGNTSEEVVQPVRIDEGQNESAIVPMGIIQYVLRTKTHVLLDDAVQSGMFTFDPYVASNGTKSVLCLPVMGQNKVVAVLYLDNNLMPGKARYIIILWY